MFKYIKKFNTHAEYESFISEDFIKPNVSLCVEENEVHYNDLTNYSNEYLTFIAKESGAFTFTPQESNVISYSIDGGETWTEGNTVSVSNGDKVMWKGTMTSGTFPLQGIGRFSSTANFDVQGNIMSLLYGDNFKEETDLTGKDNTFWRLFYQNTKIINAENLSLPATTLVSNCYSGMFGGCTSLVNAPELPATTIASNCYQNMFNGCTSLTTAPELPATALASYCYNYMFRDCTSLNYIKAMFTTTPSDDYTMFWVSGVAASGTFVKNAAAEWDVSGVNGIPNGWTVETASE